jgi:hypothetical protein
VSASVSGMNLTGSGFTQQFECRAALELQASFFNGRVVSHALHCALILPFMSNRTTGCMPTCCSNSSLAYCYYLCASTALEVVVVVF